MEWVSLTVWSEFPFFGQGDVRGSANHSIRVLNVNPRYIAYEPVTAAIRLKSRKCSDYSFHSNGRESHLMADRFLNVVGRGKALKHLISYKLEKLSFAEPYND
jgi:hypothetical protein